MTHTDQSQAFIPSAKEIREAHDLGILTYLSGNVDHYGHARAFASREQVLEAHHLGINVYAYGSARERASHEQVLEIHGLGVDVMFYAFAREHVSHEEAREAYRLGIDCISYSYAVKHVSHAEVLDVDRLGVGRRFKGDQELWGYGKAREHATREQVLEARSLGISLEGYAFARTKQASHAEVLEAHDLGIQVYDYARLRDRFSHAETLDFLTRP